MLSRKTAVSNEDDLEEMVEVGCVWLRHPLQKQRKSVSNLLFFFSRVISNTSHFSKKNSYTNCNKITQIPPISCEVSWRIKKGFVRRNLESACFLIQNPTVDVTPSNLDVKAYAAYRKGSYIVYVFFQKFYRSSIATRKHLSKVQK